MNYELGVTFRTVGLQPCYDASESVSVTRSLNTNKKSPARWRGFSLSKGKINEIDTARGESPHTQIIEDKDSAKKPAHPRIRAAHTAYPDKP